MTPGSAPSTAAPRTELAATTPPIPATASSATTATIPIVVEDTEAPGAASTVSTAPIDPLSANGSDPTVAMGVVRAPRQRSGRPPVPVIAASILVNVVALALFGLSLSLATLGPAVFVVPLFLAAVTAWFARGVWRGSRGAHVVIVFATGAGLVAALGALTGGTPALGALAVGFAGGLLGLLVGPARSREHFWGHA